MFEKERITVSMDICDYDVTDHTPTVTHYYAAVYDYKLP